MNHPDQVDVFATNTDRARRAALETKLFNAVSGWPKDRLPEAVAALRAVASSIEQVDTAATGDDGPEDEIEQTFFGFARLDPPTAGPHA